MCRNNLVVEDKLTADCTASCALKGSRDVSQRLEMEISWTEDSSTFQNYLVVIEKRLRILMAPCNLSDDVPKRNESITLSIVEGVNIKGFISPSWRAIFR